MPTVQVNGHICVHMDHAAMRCGPITDLIVFVMQHDSSLVLLIYCSTSRCRVLEYGLRCGENCRFPQCSNQMQSLGVAARALHGEEKADGGPEA